MSRESPLNPPNFMSSFHLLKLAMKILRGLPNFQGDGIVVDEPVNEAVDLVEITPILGVEMAKRGSLENCSPFSYRRCLRANARPELDLRYFSYSMARVGQANHAQ